jgi:uncharacterized DUF497 family protein
MEFRWDPAKAASNLRKHAVAFEEAATVFLDPLAISARDPDHSLEEERWLLFGSSAAGRVLVVSYTYRGEAVRLISGRVATKAERRSYENA